MKIHTSLVILFAACLAAPLKVVFAQQKSSPLVTSIYTADPFAHVFNGKLYIYPSHDIDTDKPGVNGEHYDMKDYHILSMDDINGKATDNGIALTLADVHLIKN